MAGEILCAYVLAAALAGQAQEPTQAPAAADARATVIVGDTAAPPDWELNVPVVLRLAEGAEIGRLTVQVVYPIKQLRYTGIKATEKLKTVGYTVAATAPPLPPKTAKKDATGTLTIRVQPGPDSGDKPMQAGTIVIVSFKVDTDADEKTWPMKVETVQAWGIGASAPELKAAAGPPAKFLVVPPGLPILGCFFYMH